ncbi:nitrate transporter [Klebsormidium nitens]|uniref:Nitrate transporter n=1 Tax=Klebsormidium nitens TaxID=105231 RepID=A0A1Y1HNC2_KLENI|nr:nitrate transporter [Klebsormidium nitens]|eukprot:GAQ80134.1 nitrate transporter [Klebsormidium nitens]
MADVTGVAIGRDSTGDPGDSMRGVTGREPVMAMAMTKRGTSYESSSSGFDLPVDSEHKARRIKLLSVAKPHMRAFHLSWFSFFCSQFATFAATPLIPIIRDNLDMDSKDLGNAAVASVTGTIFARLLMGSLCDSIGPRFGHAFLMLLTAPATFSMAAVDNATGFIICRMCIGFSLGVFVATQFWASVMFNGKIVGVACGATAGWGNSGGGLTQFIMPLIFALFSMAGAPDFAAWRYVFFVPGVLQVFAAYLILEFSQDLPDGQYAQLRKTGQKVKEKGHRVLITGLSNYRTWCLVATYAFSFGIELTMNNILSPYFFDRFNLDITSAGMLASIFGIINIYARAGGGIFSDMAARRWGMRGRLWTLFVLMMVQGVFMILFGRMSSLTPAVIVMVVFASFSEFASGSTFGIVPYISRRGLGIVSGCVGAGGNAGSAIVQAIFFTNNPVPTQDGISIVGIVVMVAALFVLPIYFPQWGSMLFPADRRPTSTEEEYYAGEYSADERSQHLHARVLPFAANARSERGSSFNDLLALEKDASAPAGSNQEVRRGDAPGGDVDAASKGLGALEMVREEAESRRSSFAVERAEAPGGSEAGARGGFSGGSKASGGLSPAANNESEQVHGRSDFAEELRRHSLEISPT